ncbi:isopentenyl-diphosphate Delta-isomerase [Nocardia macrotermitis]|uniref:Isopentenyl-diphosphate Delta-isomerase n=1 Tax=Nocardia macrotermitis TaxID=2585198 RepID=A0A7K0D9C1_9NOCA|nr:isopentenyl-diphosphate Delta-isomerase [Nocardia macrotermitis]MQY22141.1 Isopentenyl-diphosphate Delta-isomerase [Nocardia macrotermitis]
MNLRVDDHPEIERVVLLDEQLSPIGAAPKASVHTTQTPLHLAFSCYIFGPDGRVLLTRRAMSKKAWPGVWTNSVCGHPGPGEEMADAVRRRARQELGLEAIRDLEIALPEFRYRAVAADGIVENEYCPVWTASTDREPRPAPSEVCEWRWIEWAVLVEVIDRAPFVVSPWSQLQIPQLAARV